MINFCVRHYAQACSNAYTSNNDLTTASVSRAKYDNKCLNEWFSTWNLAKFWWDMEIYNITQQF